MRGLRRAALWIAAALCAVVIACGGHPHGSSFTVRGTVIESYSGSPVAGVTVWIAGQSATPVVTDSSGTFVFEGIHRPYDLVLVTGSTGAAVYAGVTRPDPQAEALGGYLPFVHGASTKGSVVGSDFPLGANTHVVVAFGDPVNDGTGTVDPTTGAYTFGAAWDGPSTRSVSFAALEYDDTNGDPSIAGRYRGFASGTTTITDGQTTTNPDLVLDASAVSTGHLPFVVTRPLPEILRGVGIQPNTTDPYDFPYLFGFANVSTRGSIAIPMTTPAIPVWVQMYAQDAAGGRYFVNQQAPSDLSTLTVDFPPPLTILQPSNLASVSFSQPFVLSGAEAQSVSIFDWYDGSRSIFWIGAASSATIPDLSSVGITLGTAGTTQFVAETWGPATTVDDALAHGIDVPAAPRRTAYSDNRTITLHH